jgi:hypothetical protein
VLLPVLRAPPPEEDDADADRVVGGVGSPAELLIPAPEVLAGGSEESAVVAAGAAEGEEEGVEGTLQERYDAEVARVSVPVYNGHPGTLVFGGARPPPQSKGSQIWPVSGSYQ